ncbi:Frag1/DRAM/Sfk1 [Mycena rebaudengoi]|nr:Frag1/DRAM/Sfk1 [Mycena rebaudengoi]
MPLRNSQSTEHRPRAHWWYVWIPVFSSVVWFGTILALLITWLAEGGTKATSISYMANAIAYISDVATGFLKPLFITGCCITAVTFFLSLVVERYLRHSGRLISTMRRREKVFSVLAVFGSFLGGTGLILLSVFDTDRYTQLHRIFLLLFMVGIALSSIFTIIEYRWLSKDYNFVRKLRTAYVAKGIIAGILVILGVAFGITLFAAPNVGAVLEWTISFGFTLYLLTFYYDLRQAKGVHKGELTPETMRSLNR